MVTRRYTLKQLILYVTWMCVGFGGISFSLRPWELPLDPDYDTLADLLPFARITALVVGWVVVCAAAICLVTTRRRGKVLIAALLAMLPGAFIGAIVASTLFGNGPPTAAGVFGGATLASAVVILGAIFPPITIEERSGELISERESSNKSS